MFTGQISSHARHVVHAHTSSEVMRSNTDSELTVRAPSTPTGGLSGSVAVAAATSPSLSTISLGSSGLPVMFAGHTEVQRPQTVQASVSRSCFQVNSPTRLAPTVSNSPDSMASMRLGTSRIAPLGRSRGDRYMFTGEVIMCRSFVVGRTRRKATKVSTWNTQSPWCSPAAEPSGTR